MNHRWWRAYVCFCVITTSLVPLANSQNPKPGFCGDCWCIPAPNEICPEQQPQTDFSTFLTKLLDFELENPSSLDCNPYKATNSSGCELTPSLTTDGGACVIDFSEPSDGSMCPSNWTYSLQTFPGSIEEAQSRGLYVTHGSSCGACSSLQVRPNQIDCPWHALVSSLHSLLTCLRTQTLKSRIFLCIWTKEIHFAQNQLPVVFEV
jgi:hypothetical protein